MSVVVLGTEVRKFELRIKEAHDTIRTPGTHEFENARQRAHENRHLIAPGVGTNLVLETLASLTVDSTSESCCRSKTFAMSRSKCAGTKAFSALGVLNRHSNRQFYVGSETLARRNSEADPSHSVAKNAFIMNTPATPAAPQEVTWGGQIISAIRGTNI